ncbi:hypothetical protein Dimus_014393 [Dionaea muscipula]
MASVSKVPALQPQIPSSSSSSAPLAQPEDDSWKKNTDCVYFLASPLTCKKGIECEFRHSEAARLNPRDCWYWMNSGCLNPKCAYRHPPLDSLSGAPIAASVGPSFPSAQAAPSVQYSSSKQGVQCIFFQKGYCLKGDRCPFIHGLNPTSNQVPQAPAAGTTDPPAHGKAYGGLEKCTQQKIVPQANASRPIQAIPEVKATAKAIMGLPRNGTSSLIYGFPNSSSGIVVPHNKETSVAPINETSGSKSDHFIRANSVDDSSFQNDKDADELLRESSPGFDVLVDDELRDGDYYHNEDQFMRMRGLDGRNVNESENVNELEIGHSDGYNPDVVVDPERYCDPHGYDSYDRMQDRYARVHRRGSSERPLRETVHSDRRGSDEGADLRNHLSKQRRGNGLRSVVNRDYAPPGRHDEKQSYRIAKEDSYHSPPREWPLGSRLQGRIKLPRISPVNDGSLPPERVIRDNNRISPSGRHISRSLHDRLNLRGRILEETNEGRNLRVSRGVKREMIDDNGANFDGPKSLAELKVAKQSYGGKEQQMKQEQPTSVGKLRYSMLESSQPAEVDTLSFEGPKPLSEILKRKREAEAAASTGVIASAGKEGKLWEENKEDILVKSSLSPDEQMKSQVALLGAREQDAGSPVFDNKEENKSDGDEGDVAETNKKIKMTGESSLVNDENVSGHKEEGRIAHGEEDEDHELEEYEQADGDYEYEPEDGEGYTVEDGEHADHLEEDYMDEDDGDDFAKKIGVMLS